MLNEFSTGCSFGKLRPYLSKVYTTDFDGVCTGELLDLIPKGTRSLKDFCFIN